jgi:hypothetical protein
VADSDQKRSISRLPGWIWLLLTLAAIAVFTAFSPLEKTLGVNARIVYLHGAWVWAALAGLLGAGAVGLLALLLRRERLHAWSLALGRAGLLMWVLFLPQSLYVMQANWNGLFLDEPRFRIPLNLAIVGLLLQIGLAFFPLGGWTSLGNLAFAVAVVVVMSSVQAILHPESPIFTSGERQIQFFFLGLLLLLLALIFQIAQLWLKKRRRSLPGG